MRLRSQQRQGAEVGSYRYSSCTSLLLTHHHGCARPRSKHPPACRLQVQRSNCNTLLTAILRVRFVQRQYLINKSSIAHLIHLRGPPFRIFATESNFAHSRCWTENKLCPGSLGSEFHPFLCALPILHFQTCNQIQKSPPCPLPPRPVAATPLIPSLNLL